MLVLAVVFAAGLGQARPAPAEIGPTPIPFYSGNLSVDHFMHYWGTRKEPGTTPVTPEVVAQLKRISCFAMCDYPSWSLLEREPGKWDFSLYRENAERLAASGIRYVPFCWLHFTPKWFMDAPEFVPYRCLEHGEPLTQLSLWAPATRRIYDEYYRRLAREMGESIAFIRLAMPSEYGEIGYPVGMTNWLVPQKHVHSGFWCGDPEARRHFRAWAMKRHGSVARLNSAWGTSFATAEAVEYPPLDTTACREPANAGPRRRWLDFMDWYQDSWGEFIVWSAGIVKRHFPGFGLPQPGKDLRTRKEIIFSLGYGGETACFGNDEGRHVKAIRACGGSAQTPGDIGYFATRRVSTACRFYGAPYYTEPPGDVDRLREVRRIWMDASNGAQVYFDYPQNMDRARDVFVQYKRHLNGGRSVADIALVIASTTQWLHTDWGFPPYLIGLGDSMRGLFDYEVVDERMLAEGALTKLGIRVAVLSDAEYMEAPAIAALGNWVRAGGVLIVANGGTIRDVAGLDSAWRRLAPPAAPESALGGPDLWPQVSRRIGKGAVAGLPGPPTRQAEHARAIANIRDSLPQLLPDAPPVGPRVDVGDTGLLASVFPDRILFYNGSDKPVTGRIRLVGGGWGTTVGTPTARSVEVTVDAGAIGEIALKRPRSGDLNRGR